MVNDPRSKLDLIYQEVLGDVSDLVSRVETLTGKIAEITNAENKAAQAIHDATTTASEKLRNYIESTCNTAIQKLKSAANETDAAAKIVSGSARRFAFLALLTGLAGGVIGGSLAGIALGKIFFGG